MKEKRIKIEKENGVRVEIGERDITLNLRDNDTHEQSQYNDIIGETDKYIVSLIKNVDASGKLTWIAFFLTEKDDEQDEKPEKSLAELQEELIKIKEELDSDPEFRQRVLELGEQYQKKYSTLTAEDLNKLIDRGEQ